MRFRFAILTENTLTAIMRAAGVTRQPCCTGGTSRPVGHSARRIRWDRWIYAARFSVTIGRCRRGAGRRSWPAWAGFEAGPPGCQTPMVVDLVGCGGAEPHVRPVTVVPGEVEGQFLLEGGETVRDREESSRALVLDGSDATLNHGQAAVLTDGTEPLVDAATATPALEPPGDELAALVGDKVPRLHARPAEMPFEKPPNGRGRGLAT